MSHSIYNYQLFRFLLQIVFVFSVAAPWLNFITAGPSAVMVSWLVSLACMQLLLLFSLCTKARYSLHRKQVMFFFAVAIYFVVHISLHKVSAEAGATLLAWSCFALIAFLPFAFNVSIYVKAVSNITLNPLFKVGQGKLLASLLVSISLISAFMGICQYLRLENWLTPFLSNSSDGSAYANLRQRNQFATLCGIGFLCVLFLRQTSISSNADHWLQSNFRASWHWLALMALAIGNGLSSSRTGALQWVLIVSAVVCWRTSLRADVKRLAFGGLALYILVIAIMPWFAQWVGNSNSGLLGRTQEMATISGGRITLYSNVIDLIAMKPWFGWGWRELAYAHYNTHFDVRFMELLDNAHNLPLHLAVELGVPFALVFCGTIVWAIVRSTPWRETDATRQLAWGILMLIGVHSMVEYPLWYGPFLMTLGLCIGLLQRPKLDRNDSVAQVFVAYKAIKYVALILLCLTAYLAFDYHRVSQIYLSEDSRSTLYRDDVLGAAKRSVVFRSHAQFAELVTTPVTAQTAPHVLELALKLVHFSPEPRVIEPLIESATMLHFDDIAMFHLERYKAMYPKDYAAWTALK
jgi:Virulence factor membrane-bound polymerase, C-terminal/O-Antigen ligase/Protein glycosylation ligase